MIIFFKWKYFKRILKKIFSPDQIFWHIQFHPYKFEILLLLKNLFICLYSIRIKIPFNILYLEFIVIRFDLKRTSILNFFLSKMFTLEILMFYALMFKIIFLNCDTFNFYFILMLISEVIKQKSVEINGSKPAYRIYAK